MAVLTDRKEPDDFDRDENSEEPNEYALKYLFKRRNSPTVERIRTGRVLLYSGAAANLLAALMLLVALEMRWQSLLLGLALLIVICSGLAAWRVWKQQTLAGAFGLAIAPLFLLAVALLYLLIWGNANTDAGLALYFFPGAMVMLIAALLLRNQPALSQ